MATYLENHIICNTVISTSSQVICFSWLILNINPFQLMLEVTFNCKNLLHISTVHHSDDIIGKYICLCIWEQVKAKANTGGLDCNKKYSDKNKIWKKKINLFTWKLQIRQCSQGRDELLLKGFQSKKNNF